MGSKYVKIAFALRGANSFLLDKTLFRWAFKNFIVMKIFGANFFPIDKTLLRRGLRGFTVIKGFHCDVSIMR